MAFLRGMAIVGVAAATIGTIGASIQQARENRTEWELDNCEGNASLPACQALYAQAALPPDAGLQVVSGIEGEVTPIPGADLPADFSTHMVDCGINPETGIVRAFFGGAELPNTTAALNDNPLPAEAVPSASSMCDVDIQNPQGETVASIEVIAYPEPMVKYN